MYLELDEQVQLNYQSEGDPKLPALLLWNGARCTLRQWDHVVPMLRDSFQFVRFDVRGSGHSRADTESKFTLQIYADDTCQLLSHLGVSQCHVGRWPGYLERH